MKIAKILLVLIFLCAVADASPDVTRDPDLMVLAFQPQVIRHSDSLKVGDVLQKEKTSPQIVERFSNVGLEGIGGGTLQASRVLAILGREGLDLDSISLVPPTQIQIFTEKAPENSETNRTQQDPIKVKKTVSILVAKRDLAAGDVVLPEDFEEAHLETESVEDFISSLSTLAGKRITLTRDLRLGGALRNGDFESVANPKKGDMVTISVLSKEFQIQTSGRVKEIQENGNRVLVENLDSKKEVWGKAVNEREVQIVF